GDSLFLCRNLFFARQTVRLGLNQPRGNRRAGFHHADRQVALGGAPFGYQPYARRQRTFDGANFFPILSQIKHCFLPATPVRSVPTLFACPRRSSAHGCFRASRPCAPAAPRVPPVAKTAVRPGSPTPSRLPAPGSDCSFAERPPH